MPPLRPLPYREVARKLVRAGFTAVSQRGSHVKFAKDAEDGRLTAIVPRHTEVTMGTLRSILEQAELSSDEFMNL